MYACRESLDRGPVGVVAPRSRGASRTSEGSGGAEVQRSTGASRKSEGSGGLRRRSGAEAQRRNANPGGAAEAQRSRGATRFRDTDPARSAKSQIMVGFFDSMRCDPDGLVISTMVVLKTACAAQQRLRSENLEITNATSTSMNYGK